MIDLQDGILMFIIGCTHGYYNCIGFFNRFLVINHNKKKEEEKLKKQKEGSSALW